MRTFRSDNNAGMCPEAIDAITDANDGHACAYGRDTATDRAINAFRSIFGSDISVWFVATGTAANTLAIASLTEPWQQVIAHAHSHYNEDESTAPERITHCRTVAVRSSNSKLTGEDIEHAAANSRGDVHQPQPGVVTISNPTEFGTVYSPEELKTICCVAHQHGYRVHVDGARFANAVASTKCHACELANEAGVDAMSFGGTKNGMALGEAVLFFPQGDRIAYERAVLAFPFHRKGTGHLLSKHRFVAAPFAAVLETGAWLKHAAHSNAMAGQLSEGLASLGITPKYPTQANGVFVVFPDKVYSALQQVGHVFEPFGEPSWQMYRLMTSFDTQMKEIATLLDEVRAAME